MVKSEPKTNVQLEAIRKLEALGGTIMDRLGLMARLGKSFKGRRDIYYECGYPKDLDTGDYAARFQRQDIATRIVTAYPDATWATEPNVYENEEPEQTEFEKAWEDLVKSTGFYHYVQRADILSGIGRYGVLLIGLDDGQDLRTEPVPRAGMKVIYLSPYAEAQAPVAVWDRNPKSPRYGLPELYNVTVGVGCDVSSGTQQVHWKRILHLAEGCLESDIYGTPRLENVYNRLQDIETIVAGSAEMFWKGGFQGLAFEAEADSDFDKQAKDDLAEELHRYFMGLQRYLRLQGVTSKPLPVAVADPKEHINAQLNLISAAKGIPKRILVGTEEAQLAGAQDDVHWRGRVQDRRNSYAVPYIMRPAIERFQMLGVLPPADFTVVWPPADTMSSKDKAEVARLRTEALARYADSAAPNIVPPYQYLVWELGYGDKEAKEILEQADREEPLDEEDGSEETERTEE